MTEVKSPGSSDYVQSLERGLAVIRSFSPNTRSQTLADVSRATGLSRATVRRLLLTLERLGYVQQRDRHFELTPRVLDLGYAYLTSTGLQGAATPILERLSERTQETTSVSVLDDTEIVYVARVRSKRILTMAIGIGSRLPAIQTSAGRVLLADLEDDQVRDIWERSKIEARTRWTVSTFEELMSRLREVRQQGWALNDQELEIGIRSLAIPLHDTNGKVAAALNVSTYSNRTSADELTDQFLPRLVEAGREIEAALAGGGNGAPPITWRSGP